MPTSDILTIEVLVVAAALAVAVGLVIGRRGARPNSTRPGRTRTPLAWIVAAVAVVVTALLARFQVVATSHHAASTELLADAVPRQGRPDLGYTSSDTCRACHPDQYHSWHRSYHRTMTQVAAPGVVLGDFDDVTLAHGPGTITLRRNGDACVADMIDPDWMIMMRAQGRDPLATPGAPYDTRPVVMTTGSHHYQAYWVPSRFGNMLINLPYAWLNEDARWVPREAVFLRPENADRLYQQWNNNCYRCHSTRGDPGLDPATRVFDTSVAELGISCESCHGPAEEHVRRHREPVRRYAAHLRGAAGADADTDAFARADTDADASADASAQADPSIVQPARLTATRSSQVCGQCHSIAMPMTEAIMRGERYQPGDDLERTEWIVRGTDANLPEGERAKWREGWAMLRENDPGYLEHNYWPDGMIRLAGREYNGLIESPCYAGGEFSCLSCHSIHDSAPDDQLAAGMRGDVACTQCHDAEQYATEAHTHHAPGRSGSGCYDCHMPHTTYGLLKAMRGHQVESPNIATTIATGRPNGCNLCHLDRSLTWTAGHLASWYGIAPPEPAAIADDDRDVPASVLWALRGDAGQRALAAWHMGWAPAQAASKRDWLAPYLAQLLDDPYTAVRYVAHRSLRTVPGYEDFAYDFVAPAADRAARAAAARAAWDARGGTLDETLFRRLLEARDDRVVELME